jgi:hypothetical protein
MLVAVRFVTGVTANKISLSEGDTVIYTCCVCAQGAFKGLFLNDAVVD